jgi:hypothetical protein
MPLPSPASATVVLAGRGHVRVELDSTVAGVPFSVRGSLHTGDLEVGGDVCDDGRFC